MKKLGIFDCDGVLADFTTGFEKYCAEKGWGSFSGETQERYELDMITNEQYNEMVCDPDLFSSLPTFPDVAENLTRIKQKGYTIHIVTARKCSNSVTILWLRKHGIPYDDFLPLSKKGRIEYIKQANPYFFVDDYLPSVVAAVPYCRYPFIISRRYNQVFNQNVIRIESLSEIADLVE